MNATNKPATPIDSLMNEAKALPSPRSTAIELRNVIKVLTWDKGMTRKQAQAWLAKRGYNIELHHITEARRIYRKEHYDEFGDHRNT